MEKATLPINIVISLLVSVIIGIAAYYTNLSAAERSVSDVKSDVRVLQQVDLRQKEINDDTKEYIGKISDKVDTIGTNVVNLLIANGIRPVEPPKK